MIFKISEQKLLSISLSFDEAKEKIRRTLVKNGLSMKNENLTLK
jgi:hypothetical protein